MLLALAKCHLDVVSCWTTWLTTCNCVLLLVAAVAYTAATVISASYVAITLAIVVAYTALLNIRPIQQPPGPPRLPAIGSFPFMLSEGPGLFNAARLLVRRYGSLTYFHIGRTPFVLISDYALLKEVYRSDKASSRPPIYPLNEVKLGHDVPVYRDGCGPGIILQGGPCWSEQRRFVMKNIRDFGFGKKSMEGALHMQVDKLCKYLSDRAVSAGPDCAFDFGPGLNFSVFNAIWNILVGEEVPLEEGDIAHEKKKHPMLEAYSLLHKVVRDVSPLSLLSLLLPSRVMIKWPGLRRISGFDTAKEMFGQLEGIIGSKLEEHKTSLDPANPRDLMDVMLTHVMHSTMDENSAFFHKFGDISTINIVVDFCTAGLETVAVSLRWLFLYMLHFPEIQRQVHQELDEVIGSSRLPGFEDLPLLPYVNAVILESLRFTGLAYMGLAHYTEEKLSVGKKLIPKGTIVLGNMFHIMNDPGYWQEPRKFKPERFIDSSSGKFVPDERVIAFSVGKRLCPGKSLAEKELFLFFTGVMQRFKVKKDPKESLPGIGIFDHPPTGDLRYPGPFKVVLEERRPKS